MVLGLFICVLLNYINAVCSTCRFELPSTTTFPTSNNATTIVCSSKRTAVEPPDQRMRSCMKSNPKSSGSCNCACVGRAVPPRFACWSRPTEVQLCELDAVSTVELIHGLGFVYEGYTVTTEDGYLVNINRIVHPCRKLERDKGTPILMVHGMFMHSDGWLLQAEPRDNLAVNWLMKGYDIWLGDQRGSMRSQGHVNLTTKQSKFWDFTFHESGIYDLPAFIDFILDVTGHPKLVYTGLSLGTTFHMVLCSERPEYNNKLYGAIDFVPVGFQPVLSSLPPAVQMNIVYIRDAFLTYLESNAYYVKNLVTIKRELTNICLNLPQMFMWYIAVFMGTNGNFKPEHFCWQFTTMFSGTSVIVVLHTIQLFETANFTRYDYGDAENIRRYGRPEPPGYDLTRVTSPVAFYTSEQDSFSPSHVVDNMLDMFGGLTYRCTVQNVHHLDINFGIQFKRILPDVNLLLDSLTGRTSPIKMNSGTCPTKISRLG